VTWSAYWTHRASLVARKLVPRFLDSSVQSAARSFGDA
jgi:hypothetical protein